MDDGHEIESFLTRASLVSAIIVVKIYYRDNQ